METFTLPARRRTAVGKHSKSLLLDGIVPAVLYGHGVENVNLEVASIDLQKIVRQAGSSSLVDLVIDDASPLKVLIHEVQRHPTKSSLTHVDFYQVKMTEKLETEIELAFVGESPAVKEQGGIFLRTIDKVKVTCLPSDLVPSLPIDISVLKTFEDRIRIADIVVPKGITIMEDPESIIASVTPPRSEEELKELEQTVTEDVSAVEKVEKPKEEEEVPVEGENGLPPAETKT